MAHDSNQSLRIGYLFFLVPTSNKPMGEEKIIFNEWKFEKIPSLSSSIVTPFNISFRLYFQDHQKDLLN